MWLTIFCNDLNDEIRLIKACEQEVRDYAYKTLGWLSIFIKVYMTEFFCLLDQIFILLSYENRKQIGYPFYFATFEAHKSVKFHFRLCTIPREARDWG